jgi:tetratricopeptide (TPR) repeat protein
MKRSRAVAPRLKHLAFFEKLVDVAEETPTYRGAIAGLLTLRLIDHWVLAGAVMVEPESGSVRAVRQAIMAIAANDPQREVLLGVVNTMQTLREVDMQPLLPRMFAYAGMLEKRGMLELAADAYESVVRLGQEEYEADLVIDSHMRLGYCRRVLGAMSEAERAYSEAHRISKRQREVSRQLRARIGLALVKMNRGNLPEADEMLGEIIEESARTGERTSRAAATHERARVAHERGDTNRAVCLAYDALQLTESAASRDRVLSDLGAFFVVLGRFDVARDALLIQEATTTEQDVRCRASINLLSLAAREGDAVLFDQYRALLQKTALPPSYYVNFLIESARGLRRFGDNAEADRLLTEARAFAERNSLNRSIFEIESLISMPAVAHQEKASGGTRVLDPDPAAHIASALRSMAASIVS